MSGELDSQTLLGGALWNLQSHPQVELALHLCCSWELGCGCGRTNAWSHCDTSTPCPTPHPPPHLGTPTTPPSSPRPRTQQQLNVSGCCSLQRGRTHILRNQGGVFRKDLTCVH